MNFTSSEVRLFLDLGKKNNKKIDCLQNDKVKVSDAAVKIEANFIG